MSHIVTVKLEIVYAIIIITIIIIIIIIIKFKKSKQIKLYKSVYLPYNSQKKQNK